MSLVLGKFVLVSLFKYPMYLAMLALWAKTSAAPSSEPLLLE
jgi:hypothetical protein